MQTKVNRYAFILGGCNAIWYAVVYFTQKLYATAAYALFFSAMLHFSVFGIGIDMLIKILFI